MILLTSTASAVKKRNLVKKVAALCNKALRLMIESPALSYFVQHRSEVLKQNFTILEGFLNPSEH